MAHPRFQAINTGRYNTDRLCRHIVLADICKDYGVSMDGVFYAFDNKWQRLGKNMEMMP